ncbi:MAG: hypothetical protein ABIJ03_02860 [Patescibacteria group bacterium]
MENNNSTQNSISQTKTVIDYPVKAHFKDAWHRFTGGLLPAFLVTLIVMIIVLVVVAVLGIAGFGLVAGNEAILSAIKDIGTLGPTALLSIPSGFWLSIIGLFLIYMVVCGLLGLVSQTAIILALTKYDQKPSLGSLLKQSFSLVPVVFVLGLVSSLLVLGGTWLFVLPGILIGLMFSFAMYEVVLENKGPISALKSSTALISDQFGFFITRILIFTGIYLLAFVFMPMLLSEVSTTLENLYSLVSSLASIGWGWFSLAFMIELYLKIKQASTSQKPGNITWMIVVAVLGWLLLVLGIKILVNFAKSDLAKELTQSIPGQIEAELNQADIQQAQPSLDPNWLECQTDSDCVIDTCHYCQALNKQYLPGPNVCMRYCPFSAVCVDNACTKLPR